MIEEPVVKPLVEEENWLEILVAKRLLEAIGAEVAVRGKIIQHYDAVNSPQQTGTNAPYTSSHRFCSIFQNRSMVLI